LGERKYKGKGHKNAKHAMALTKTTVGTLKWMKRESRVILRHFSLTLLTAKNETED
jgi:hypothetical protein